MINIGYLAAGATSFCWSCTSMFFASAGKRIGSNTVNQYRIFLAVVFLAITHFILRGWPWPIDATLPEFGYLALSGIIGLLIGDTCFFAALVILGPKRAAVCMTLHTAFAAIIAWFVLGESLTAVIIIGMSVTILGIGLTVTSGKRKDISSASRRRIILGVVLGLLGGLCQGAGLVVAKMGLDDGLSSISGTFIRMSTAAVCLWSIALVQVTFCIFKGRPSAFRNGFKNRKAILYTLGGAFFGPFLGVWMSLVAIQSAPIAKVTTIMATFPILIIPHTMIFYREKPKAREVAGALIAVLGVAILCEVIF